MRNQALKGVCIFLTGDDLMRITDIRTGMLSAPLKTPFKTALRTVTHINDIAVEICTDTGNRGYGEAPPTGVITGDTLGGITGAITEHIAPKLIGRDIDDLEDIMNIISGCVLKNSSAKAAVDMAVYDLYGQLYNVPVYKLLGGSRKHLITDITISVNDPDVMAEDAVKALKRGYDTLKIKVGIDPALDVERLMAVRQAVGKDIRIRVDANQAWTKKQAVRILEEMEEKSIGIEFVEQPVKAHDIEGLKYVTDNSPVEVLADESVFSPQDALRIMQMHAADMVNIKLMKCGGIHEALRIASAAEIYGMQCMIGCMLETKLSVNAAVHVACARSIITKIDLDGPNLCSEDPVMGGAVFDEKDITVSDLPGLGITGLQGVSFKSVIQ